MAPDRYFVFDRADLNAALTRLEKHQFQAICLKVARLRLDRGERPALPVDVVERKETQNAS